MLKGEGAFFVLRKGSNGWFPCLPARPLPTDPKNLWYALLCLRGSLPATARRPFQETFQLPTGPRFSARPRGPPQCHFVDATLLSKGAGEFHSNWPRAFWSTPLLAIKGIQQPPNVSPETLHNPSRCQTRTDKICEKERRCDLLGTDLGDRTGLLGATLLVRSAGTFLGLYAFHARHDQHGTHGRRDSSVTPPANKRTRKKEHLKETSNFPKGKGVRPCTSGNPFARVVSPRSGNLLEGRDAIGLGLGLCSQSI